MQYTSIIDYFSPSSREECLTTRRMAAPLDNNNGLESIVSSSYRRAPFIAFITICMDEKKVKELEIIPNSLRSLRKASSSDVLNWLLKNHVELIVIPLTDKDLLSVVEKSGTPFLLIDPGLILSEVLEIAFKA